MKGRTKPEPPSNKRYGPEFMEYVVDPDTGKYRWRFANGIENGRWVDDVLWDHRTYVIWVYHNIADLLPEQREYLRKLLA